MAFRKIRDAAVVTGTYTDGSGQTKKRYKNVGAVMRGDDGSSFLLLEAAFNPAGVPRKEGSDQIVISFFELRDAPQPQPRPAPPPPPSQPDGTDDDIPF